MGNEQPKGSNPYSGDPKGSHTHRPLPQHDEELSRQIRAEAAEKRMEKNKPKYARKKFDRNMAIVRGEFKADDSIGIGAEEKAERSSIRPKLLGSDSKKEEFVSQASNQRLRKAAEAAHRRHEETLPVDIGKAKRGKNFALIFGDREQASPERKQKVSFTKDQLLDRVTELVQEVDSDEACNVLEVCGKFIQLNNIKVILKTLKLMKGICSNSKNDPINLCIVVQHSKTLENQDKYRKIRISNEKVQDDLVAVKGAVECLLSVGFTINTMFQDDGTEDDFLYYHPSNPIEQLEDMIKLINFLTA